MAAYSRCRDASKLRVKGPLRTLIRLRCADNLPDQAIERGREPFSDPCMPGPLPTPRRHVCKGTASEYPSPPAGDGETCRVVGTSQLVYTSPSLGNIALSALISFSLIHAHTHQFNFPESLILHTWRLGIVKILYDLSSSSVSHNFLGEI